MKWQILLFCLFSAACAQNVCFEKECEAKMNPGCSPTYGKHIHKAHMKELVNTIIRQSYEYLLSGAYFDVHSHNRPGFAKMYDKLSDETWEDSRELIKHLYKRGLTLESGKETMQLFFDHKSEIKSLGKALDMQKEKATQAFNLVEHHDRDPEIVSFLEEHLLHKDSKWIRDIAGYISDINKIIGDSGSDNLGLGLEIFDSYLLSKY